MTSKTRQSGRVDILVRMAPELKARVTGAAHEDGVSINDWLLDAVEQVLADRDAEVAAGKNKADLERRLEMKFQEIVASLAGGDLTSLSVKTLTKIHEQAEAAIGEWRNHASAHYHAEPRTPLERLCKDHFDIWIKIEGGTESYINTFDDDDLDDLDLDDAGAG